MLLMWSSPMEITKDARRPPRRRDVAAARAGSPARPASSGVLADGAPGCAVTEPAPSLIPREGLKERRKGDVISAARAVVVALRFEFHQSRSDDERLQVGFTACWLARVLFRSAAALDPRTRRSAGSQLRAASRELMLLVDEIDAARERRNDETANA